MRKAVNNLSDATISLGGVEIGSKSQRVVRQSLITDEEQKKIVGSGCSILFGATEITVAQKVKLTEGDANKDINATKKPDNSSFKSVYPSSVITKEGNLSGSPVAKKAIEAIHEKYGEDLISDNEFKELYPDADVEICRVAEVGEDE